MRTSARTTALPAIALPAMLVLLLAGCAAEGTGADPGATGSSGATSAPADGAGEDGTGCPYGVWSLDVPDLAVQLESSLEESMGKDATVVGDGEQRIEWGADGAVEFTTDLTITVTATLDDDLEMVMTQVHSGGAGGDLAYADGVATPSGWDGSTYAVATSMTIGGVDAPVAETPVGALFDASTPMQITCDGDTMLTHTAPSPYTQRWLRQD